MIPTEKPSTGCLLERNIIRERVTAGLRRAKKEGKTLGRPRVIVDREKVRQLHGQGNSVRIIAAQLGLTKSTVHPQKLLRR